MLVVVAPRLWRGWPCGASVQNACGVPRSGQRHGHGIDSAAYTPATPHKKAARRRLHRQAARLRMRPAPNSASMADKPISAHSLSVGTGVATGAAAAATVCVNARLVVAG